MKNKMLERFQKATKMGCTSISSLSRLPGARSFPPAPEHGRPRSARCSSPSSARPPTSPRRQTPGAGCGRKRRTAGRRAPCRPRVEISAIGLRRCLPGKFKICKFVDYCFENWAGFGGKMRGQNWTGKANCFLLKKCKANLAEFGGFGTGNRFLT